jgi:sorbitol-specific phosphotransferase system component IIA
VLRWVVKGAWQELTDFGHVGAGTAGHLGAQRPGRPMLSKKDPKGYFMLSPFFNVLTI